MANQPADYLAFNSVCNMFSSVFEILQMNEWVTFLYALYKILKDHDTRL